MWSFITSIPGLITGLFGSINHVTDALTNEKIALRNAQTEEERIAAQERVNTLTLRRDAMMAEVPYTRLNVLMRFALACCVLVVLVKILVWDKSVGPFYGCVGKLDDAAKAACKMFTTDALDPNLWWVVGAVVGFYFLTEITAFFKRR
jgi:hypothetical protein